MASKYTESELQDLYTLACREGWDQLEPGERLALGRWCKRNGIARPGVEPSEPAAKPAKPAKPAVEASEAPVPEGVEFMDDWPDGILPVQPVTNYQLIADALRAHPGRPARIRRGLTRKQAVETRIDIRRARTKAFQPKGAFRAEVAPDGGGRYGVYVAYLGEA